MPTFPLQNSNDYLIFLIDESLNPDDFEEVRLFVCKSLNNPDSNLFQDLILLTPKLKSQLIAALLTNNGQIIDDFCLLWEYPTIKLSTLNRLNSFHNNSKVWVNEYTQGIIETLLKDKHGKDLPTHEGMKILCDALSLIPETLMTIQAKRELYQSLDIKHIYWRGGRFIYRESVAPLQCNLYNPKINQQQLKKILALPEVSISQFILLTSLYLDSFGLKEARELLPIIHKAYFNLDYKKCLTLIKNLIKNAKANFDMELRDLIAENIESFNLTYIEDPSRNFYENRVAALYSGNYLRRPADLALINRFAQALGGSHEPAGSPEEVYNLMSLISENMGPAISKRGIELQLQSINFKNRNKVFKPGFCSKWHEMYGRTADSIFSANPGIMRSTQPNFPLELTTNLLRNQAGDIAKPSHLESNQLHSYSPYVAGISGHMFMFLALVENFLESGKAEAFTHDEINHLFNTYLASYVSCGFHSFSELIRVLEEPTVQAIFAKHHFAFQNDWHPQILAMAFRDTQEYAKHYVTRKLLHEELVNNPVKLKPISKKSSVNCSVKRNLNALSEVTMDRKSKRRNCTMMGMGK